MLVHVLCSEVIDTQLCVAVCKYAHMTNLYNVCGSGDSHQAEQYVGGGRETCGKTPAGGLSTDRERQIHPHTPSLKASILK